MQWGVYITDVAAGSPASKAGLQQGDIITSLGGVALDATHSYINTLFTFKPGDKIVVEFNRNSKTMQAQVILATASSN